MVDLVLLSSVVFDQSSAERERVVSNPSKISCSSSGERASLLYSSIYRGLQGHLNASKLVHRAQQSPSMMSRNFHIGRKAAHSFISGGALQQNTRRLRPLPPSAALSQRAVAPRHPGEPPQADGYIQVVLFTRTSLKNKSFVNLFSKLRAPSPSPSLLTRQNGSRRLLLFVAALRHHLTGKCG